jgi:predicted MFS family arabinose efflux permease
MKQEGPQVASRGALEPLRSGSFALLWAARVLSLAGSHASRTALVLLLAQEASAPLSVGLLVWCEILPASAAAFLASGWIDRRSKRSLMLAADFVRAAGLAAAAMAGATAVFLVVVAMNSMASSFFGPARAAVIPRILPPRLLDRANALDQGASTAMMMIGPLLGAQLYFALGIRWALLADAASFLASAALILLVAPVEIRGETRATPLHREIGDGWRYLTGHPIAGAMVLLSAVSLLAAGMWTPLAAPFVRTCLRAGDGVIALQLAAFGAGGLVGAATAAHAAGRVGRGRLLAGMLLSEAAAMLLYSRVHDATLSSVVMFLWGAVVSGIAVPFYSVLQETVSARYAGRVFAIHGQAESAAGAAAIAAAILAARLATPQNIFAAAGALYAAVILTALFSRGGRELLRAR